MAIQLQDIAQDERHAAYHALLASKRGLAHGSGLEVDADAIHPALFPFQRDLTRWSLRKGRAAIFADTGLGKTRMQVEWARLIGQRTLIVAPLSVTRQTVAEAARIGVDVHTTRSGDDLREGVNITNYEMLSHFDPAAFAGVVLDESSILKAMDGKTRMRLTEMFAGTPYRLCCTATPAPNDISEIANHAEFLGVMTRADMLAMYFVHDDNGWRLKRHAEDAFYRWMASWGMSVRKPSDLGYRDDGYILPELRVEPLIVPTGYTPDNTLFFSGLKGVTGRAAARRGTLAARVDATAQLVNNGSDEQWIIWCGLNDEGRALAALIPDAALMEGSQSPEEKTAAIEAFQDGRVRVLITKPSIAGFGLNLQQCHQMAFVGMNDSWEDYYQCIRRCYRFGQQYPVNAYLVVSDVEQEIYANVMRKEREAHEMASKLIEHVQQFERAEIGQSPAEQWTYQQRDVAGEDYVLMLGDSTERLAEVADESVGLSVFSPPFQSLYTYSPTERDLGNSRTIAEFEEHFGYICDEVLRVTQPGRNCCVHVSQVPAMLARDGYIGLKDFRGDTIRLFERHGWIYHGEVCIDKDPQAQAIRTKSKSLLFVQLRKDASWLRPALADYILVFRKPGDNKTPIQPDMTNEEWIEWARPIWYGIKESDTLNVAEGRDRNDERHICPLQLGTIARCVRLWSNPGDLVLSPFAGIGSEGYEALRLGRRYVGIELKESYFQAATRNLERMASSRKQVTLFDGLE